MANEYIKKCSVSLGIREIKTKHLRFHLTAFRIAIIKNKSPVAHACIPSYSRGRDQENFSLKPARANSSRDPISKKNLKKSKKQKGGHSGSHL
jgi:hypothetical protein